jgi:hypothetical protein
VVDKPDQADGFLGRWARRKNQALQGKPLDEPVAPVRATAAPIAASPPTGATPATPSSPPATQGAAAASEPAAESAKPLSLDDVKDLTKDSDFKPFMNRGVDAGVRNAAMKKLFADPHFNVMDRLDIYIDDYSLPDPLPLSMLRQMASAKFLKLVDDEDEAAKAAAQSAPTAEPQLAGDGLADPAVPAPESAASAPGDATDSMAAPAPAQDEPGAATALPPPDPPQEAFLTSGPQENHAHIDLRLQPDHAPESPSPGRGAA